jgi:hypothetical protein
MTVTPLTMVGLSVILLALTVMMVAGEQNRQRDRVALLETKLRSLAE